MNNLVVRRWAGLLVVVVPIIFTIGFTLLQMEFEYPDILRQPTADVLQKFTAGGPRLIATWYVLPMAALLFIPTAVLVHQVVATPKTSTYMATGTTFGVVAGVVQTLGLIRWPFLVPHLAESTFLLLRATPSARRQPWCLKRFTAMPVSPWENTWAISSQVCGPCSLQRRLCRPAWSGRGSVLSAWRWPAESPWAFWKWSAGMLWARSMPSATWRGRSGWARLVCCYWCSDRNLP